MAPTLEVCVDNFESVIAAVEGGCVRIELCSSLLDGGLTPSVGLLRQIKRTYPRLLVFVMIRPRGGDFCYSSEELQIMAEDIEVLHSAGADGFVFGCLAADGSLDLEANRLLLKKANSLPCTFHRAIDMAQGIERCLEQIIELGFARVLTSGQCKSAIDGIEQIRQLVHLAQDRIIIIPGSGVNADNLQAILSATKAKEFHSSASIPRHSDMQYRNARINMGSNSHEFTWKVCSSVKVKQLIEIANLLNAN